MNVLFLLGVGFVLLVSWLAVARLVPARWRLLTWMMVVVAVVVPWTSWVGHSHWGRVDWLPFSPPLRKRDIALNVLLYVPLGYFFVRDGRLGNRVGMAVALAFGLSLATEFTQVYSHGRFPALTDVVTNTAGAWIGAAIARREVRQPVRAGGREAVDRA